MNKVQSYKQFYFTTTTLQSQLTFQTILPKKEFFSKCWPTKYNLKEIDFIKILSRKNFLNFSQNMNVKISYYLHVNAFDEILHFSMQLLTCYMKKYKFHVTVGFEFECVTSTQSAAFCFHIIAYTNLMYVPFPCTHKFIVN